MYILNAFILNTYFALEILLNLSIFQRDFRDQKRR
jgi:hypothetical protein